MNDFGVFFSFPPSISHCSDSISEFSHTFFPTSLSYVSFSLFSSRDLPFIVNFFFSIYNKRTLISCTDPPPFRSNEAVDSKPPSPSPPPIALHLIRFTYNLSNFNSKSKNSMSWRKPLIDFEFLDRHDCISAAYLFLLLSFLSFLSHFQFIPSICGHPHEIENFFCSKYSTISMNHICASELHIIQFV